MYIHRNAPNREIKLLVEINGCMYGVLDEGWSYPIAWVLERDYEGKKYLPEQETDYLQN